MTAVAAAIGPYPADPSLDLTIATRESRLALWQAEHVQARLQAGGHRVRLLGMTTRGDQILDRVLSKVGGKGLFVKELEVALEEGRADLAVHSLKDVPMELPAGFALACVTAREDPRDAWVSSLGDGPEALPQGAVIGTSSLRRLVQLRAWLRRLGRDDVRIEPLRGNLDTRLRKLDEGLYHAIVLAAAGLKRLGLQARIRRILEPHELLPAAGQGALGIEIRAERADVAAALQPLAHWPTWCAVEAERSVSRALGGSCSVPLAAYAQWAGSVPQAPGEAGLLTLHALWGDAQQPDRLCRVELQAEAASLEQARALGEQAARALLEQGARVAPSC
ncbi:Porphobilinogen deaminase [Tepidimonas alkaliphilus]|uniref:Porphobilinogen deaminase n=1 Tax=Tepidimonas alkaliphilus TaxID=2588942 RepID=A0A554WCV2_9BURK|nr:hydroxymethylbilane synthase [Tepidimonas alkaliphilus]TSE21403.1 Porphobilinogen deaminase [Tepidimonas alkaliphilus]